MADKRTTVNTEGCRKCGIPSLSSFGEVLDLCRKSGARVIGIDGRAASGKTTLAARLAPSLNAAVVHVDDFYLPFHLRTAERMATAGGHIDHERLLNEAVLPLLSGASAVFAPFDCATGGFGTPVTMSPAPVVIVEGSYSLHPAMGDVYGLRIFSDIDAAAQADRLRCREGAYFAAFKEKWIPLEETYFRTFAIKESCDAVAVIDGDDDNE